MPRRKADITVADIIVEVRCPECFFPQPSADWPGSFGWDGAEVRKHARASVVCFKCGEYFNIPASLLAFVGEL
jgi:ribosomal protein S27E